MLEKFKLSNGIPVYVVRLASGTGLIPYSAMSIAYKYGSAVESPKELGLVHMGEHMVFRRKKGKRLYSRDLVKKGGIINAYTGPDSLMYLCGFTDDIAVNGIKDFATMVSREDVPDGIEKEKTVIASEMIPDSEEGSETGEAFLTHLYKGTRAQYSLLGKPELVNNYTEDDIQRIYDKLLNTKDMGIFVATSLEAEQFVDMFEDLFGERKKKAKSYRWQKGKGPGKLGMIIEKETPVSGVFIGWPTHGYKSHKKHIMTRLLELIIGGDEAGMLYKSLRYSKGLVYDIDITVTSYYNFGCFIIILELEPGAEVKAKAAIDAAIKKVKSGKINKSDLLYAKRQLYIRWASVLSEPLSCVDAIGSLWTSGWGDFIPNGTELLEEITVDEVIDFSKELFDDRKLMSVMVKGIQE